MDLLIDILLDAGKDTLVAGAVLVGDISGP